MKLHLLFVAFFCFFISTSSAQLNLQWEEIGSDNLGGYVYGIVVDKRDATRQTVYAGTFGGGVWKSTDGANTWNKLQCTDNMLVSCMTQEGNGTIWVGTGNYGFGSGAVSLNNLGNGIYTIDSNDQIHQLPSTSVDSATSPWGFVYKIDMCTGSPVYAATSGGLFMSGDTGKTWGYVAVAGIGNGAATDVAVASNGIDVYAIVGGGNKMIKSPNCGFTWDRVTSLNSPGFPAIMGNTKIALAPTNSNVIYLSVATATGATQGVYRSQDGGVNWDTVALKNSGFDPFSPNNQGWFDNVITVSPTNENEIYCGGVNMYTWSQVGGLKSVLQFNDLTIDTADYVDQFIYAFNDLSPHEMYVGSTRGVFKSVDAVSGFPYPIFGSKNQGLNVRDFRRIGAARNGIVMGSTSVVSTAISQCGTKSFEEIAEYNGHCEFSHLDTNRMYVCNYSGKLNTSTDYGQSFHSVFDSNIDPQNYLEPSACGNPSGGNAPFITPMLLHETKTAYNNTENVQFLASQNYLAGDTIHAQSNTAQTPFVHTLSANVSTGNTINIPDPVVSRVFLTSYCGVWMKRHALNDAAPNDWYKLTQLNTANCYHASANGNNLYYGTTNGKIYRLKGLNTVSYSNYNMVSTLADSLDEIAALPTSWQVSSISVSADEQTILAGLVQYANTEKNVLLSTNGGSTWDTLLLGYWSNPAHSCLVDVSNKNNLVVGTQHGIWSSNNGGTSWQQNQSEFCEIPVLQLRQLPYLEDGCPVVYVATGSRGIWRSFSLTPNGCNTNTCLAPTGINVPFSPEETTIHVFPNPANNSFTVSVPVNLIGQTLTVTDITGKQMAAVQLSTQNSAFSTANFASGIYFVKVSNTVKKLIVKR